MLAYLPFEVLRSIPLPTFAALFAAFGSPSTLASPPASHAAVADALATSDVPLPLARAIFLISPFTTEVARAEIYAAADALGCALPWADAASPADLLARALIESLRDPAVAELVIAAKILRDRSFRARASFAYAARPGTESAVGTPARHALAIAEHFATWGRRRGFGAVLPVRAWEVEHVLFFEIVHEDRLTTDVVLDPAASAPRVVTARRPLRSHLVAYAPTRGRGRLTITTDAPEAVTPLAEIFGRAWFDDARHFLDAQALDLWRLQELGAASLAVPELAARLTMRAIGGTWHSGKRHAITPRGLDFFKALARYKIRIEGGRLDLVTLRGVLPANDGGPTTCDVVVSPPHHLTVSEPELAPLMHDWLDHARITTPELRPRDFFSRQPWIDSLAGWIESEGEAGFRELVARGILKADPSNRSVAPPGEPHAGRIATAFPLSGTKYLAWSADPTIAPFVVEERDLVAYALQFDKLAEAIAEALGLTGAATKLDEDGVLFCGRRVLGPTYVVLFLLTRPIRETTAARLADFAGHGHAILVVPETRRPQYGQRTLAMPPLAGPWQPLLAGIVRTLRLTQHVETIVYAPAEARVVLDRAIGCIWIDDVLCSAAKEMHFRLLEVFLIRGAAQVHTKEIAEHVAQGHPHEDTTRRAIETFVPAVQKSFKAAKKKPPKDLAAFIAMPRHGYYALTVKGFVD